MQFTPRAFAALLTAAHHLAPVSLMPGRVFGRHLAAGGALYLDAMKVSDKEAEWASYEDDFFTVMIRPEAVEIETKAPVEQTGAPAKVKLSLGEAKFLLLKWRLECMRWEAT